MPVTTLTTAFEGHTITTALVGGMWESVIDAHIPLMERDYLLRSTYASRSVATSLRAAMWDVDAYLGVLEALEL